MLFVNRDRLVLLQDMRSDRRALMGRTMVWVKDCMDFFTYNI
jgi:hypothetical protein